MKETKVSVNFGLEFFKDENVEAFILRAPNGQVYSVSTDFVQFSDNLSDLIADLQQAYDDQKRSASVVEKV